MATFKLTPPDDLQDESNADINMLHSTITNLVAQLNYGLGQLDTENMTDDIASIIENMGGNNNGNE